MWRKSCTDCVGRERARRPDWFTDVCRPPHTLIWAEKYGDSYWPAKAMGLNDDRTKVAVCFFGKHERKWVSVKRCYWYSKKPPRDDCDKANRRHVYERSLNEVDSYIQKYTAIYESSFPYAAHRQHYFGRSYDTMVKLYGDTVRASLLCPEPALSIDDELEPNQVANERSDGFYVERTPQQNPAPKKDEAISKRPIAHSIRQINQRQNTKPNSVSRNGENQNANHRNSEIKRVDSSTTRVINSEAPCERNTVQSNQAAAVSTIETVPLDQQSQHNAHGGSPIAASSTLPQISRFDVFMLAVEHIEAKHWCSVCGIKSKEWCCSKTWYCSFACQMKHWPTHKAHCTNLHMPILTHIK